MSGNVVTLPVVRIERHGDKHMVPCEVDLGLVGKLDYLARKHWGGDTKACASALLTQAITDATPRGRR